MCMKFGEFKLIIRIGKTWETRGYYCETHVKKQEKFFEKKGKSTNKISVIKDSIHLTCSKLNESDKDDPNFNKQCVYVDNVGKYISGSDEDYKSEDDL